MNSSSNSSGESPKKEWFIYSFVARGMIVVAEYAQYASDFPAIAAQCLRRLPSSDDKFTYNCDHHTINFLLDNGYAYCVVAKESVSKQISIAFLERVKADFSKRYEGGEADTASAKRLNKEFGPILKEHMKYIVEHAEEIEKLIKVKAQVSEVRNIMIDTIDKAIGRGESIATLTDKTEDLHNQAQQYRVQGTQLRRTTWYQNMKIKLVILGILILLILVIWISICHGFNCSKTRNLALLEQTSNLATSKSTLVSK